jgi:hypothetical protein
MLQVECRTSPESVFGKLFPFRRHDPVCPKCASIRPRELDGIFSQSRCPDAIRFTGVPSIQAFPPTPTEVTEIVALQDRLVRNLRITDCYARLSSSVRALNGDGANWCTFATWASKQAGCTIRGEDLGDRLCDFARQGWLFRHPARSLWRTLLRRGLFDSRSRVGRLVHAINTPFDAFERASEAVAEGNLKVFEEIGFQFARYICCCHDSTAFTDFLDSLRPGPAPQGQELLRTAFTHYQQARQEMSLPRRAQWLLLGNLEIGFHEQIRLQPEIERAMNAGPDTADDLKRRLLAHFGFGWLARLSVAVLMFPARRYHRFVREVTRRVISDTLMVLRTPVGLLHLGRNIDAALPLVFKQLDLLDLITLVQRVEPSVGNCMDCGAKDWADLGQRMHYIFHLFSTLHEQVELFQAPFTAEQVALVASGELPDGRL